MSRDNIQLQHTGRRLFEEGAADCALDPEGGHNITVLTRFQ